MYRLFLDDIRSIRCVNWNVIHIGHTMCKFPVVEFEDAIIVRDYEEFVNCIDKNGIPTHISFDHDLADFYYAENMTENLDEKTGFDCAKYMVDYCMNNSDGINNLELPEHIYIHSFNPIGRQKIHDYILSYKKVIKLNNE